MEFVFDSWRGERCPDGWTVEAYTEYTHQHGEVRPDGYALIPHGNLHLPLVPELADVDLDVCFQVNPELTGGVLDFSLVFRYDRRCRRGYAVRIQQRADALRVAFGEQHGNQFRSIEERVFGAIELTDAPMQAMVEVTGTTVTVRFGGHTVCFEAVPRGVGSVALGRGCFFGELLIKRLAITSSDETPCETILPRTTVAFPADIDGMDVPIRYSVEVNRHGGIYEVNAELSGGVPEKVCDHPGNYHCRVIDWLTRPYIRFAGTASETDNLYLADDTLVLCAEPTPNAFFYGQFYDKPEWPLKVQFRLEQFPVDPLLVLGYEHYCCEAAQQREGGPTEVFIDLPSKETRHWGRALGTHDASIRLESLPNPRLLGQLPTSDPRHAQAVEYVRNNHFFSEGDDCRFTPIIEFGRGLAVAELRLHCRLENAFFEPLEDYRECQLTASEVPIAFMQRVVGTLPFGSTLAVGVYHLRAQLSWGGRLVEEHCAFEVMPTLPSAAIAPQASGLPVMFNMPNEITGLETDTFDPWQGISDDVAHYTAISCFYPDFARTNRIWDVVRLYGREWFVWISSRTTDRPSLENHLDLIAECDYVSLRDGPHNDSIDRWLARPECYTDVVMGALRQFAAETGREDLGIPDSGGLDHTTFRRLLETCWHEWLAYYSHFYMHQLIGPLQDQLRACNSRLKFAAYGPYQAYAAHYKGTHHLNVFGLGNRAAAEAQLDGFRVFEDYPVACKYSLCRGVYMLAACKMAMPRVKMSPEIYTRGVNGCPDGAVYYAWPPMGMFGVDDSVLRKRVFEYALATVWFDQGAFSYWQDHGFHVRNSTRERYEIILRAWQVVRNHPPKRPLRTTAFVNSEACCRAHGSRISTTNRVFNTTEEAPAWAYEMARLDGQPAGIVTCIEAIDQFSAADIDTLVLPPLHAVSEEELAAIRRLHEEGVSLLAFENVNGLEDLFGVVEADTPGSELRHVQVNTGLPENPLTELASLTEFTETVPDPLRYTNQGAHVLLTGEGPVLFHHRTEWGQTALYNLAPTMVRRADLRERFGYGEESISDLINRSAQLMLRELGSPDVETTQGKLIAYRDHQDAVVIVVEEDAFPATPEPINPGVTIHIPGLVPEHISCDREFAVVKCTDSQAVLRLALGPNDCAVITIAGA